LEVTPAIQELILKMAPEGQIRQQAVQDGMVTLKSEGLMKILDSVTSIEEVVGVTGKQDDPVLRYQSNDKEIAAQDEKLDQSPTA
jgi:type IV pilus assembly protein PilB